MNNQAQSLSTSDILGQAYNYAFLEIPSYHFMVPKSPDFTPAIVRNKENHCLHCGKVTVITYENHGEIYLDKTRLKKQQDLYSKYTLSFPDIEKGESLAYQQEGYCAECFPSIQQAENEKAQFVYTVCSQIIQMDLEIIPALTALAKQILAKGGIKKDEVNSFLSKDERVQKILQQYRIQFQRLSFTAKKILEEIQVSKLEAYVGKPLNMLESMSDSIFNEYTVAIPTSDTPDGCFFIKATIKKADVEDFLNLPRVDNVEKFLAEPGILEFLYS